MKSMRAERRREGGREKRKGSTIKVEKERGSACIAGSSLSHYLS